MDQLLSKTSAISWLVWLIIDNVQASLTKITNRTQSIVCLLPNIVAKGEVKEGLDSNLSCLRVTSTNFSKIRIFMTLFLSGIRYYRALFNVVDIQLHGHVDAFAGIGAEALLNLWWPEGQHISQMSCNYCLIFLYCTTKIISNELQREK